MQVLQHFSHNGTSDWWKRYLRIHQRSRNNGAATASIKLWKNFRTRADVAFVGIGDMGIGCPMHRDGFITKEEVRELVKSGRCRRQPPVDLSQAGEPVPISIQDRVTSIQLPRPSKKAGHRLCWRRAQSSGSTWCAAWPMDQRTCHRRDLRPSDPGNLRRRGLVRGDW
jgi:hypothetical protein